ncbi:MAG: GNAT family N-acetyltransferase [Planctomycetales bacterium]|nr:GNAT family N-acetyltransferase [Planctomycetales bacterium]
MDWIIRCGLVDDTEILVKFNEQMALETEGKVLDQQIVSRGVWRALQGAPETRYYVAEHQQQVIGQLMVTREWSDWRDGWLWWLQSVYVDPKFRGRGVFRSLVVHVLKLAEQAPDTVGVRLYVERENRAAQAVYQRTGFQDSGYLVLEKMLSP